MQCDCVSMSSLICFGSYDSKCDCFTGSEILCVWSSCDRHGLKEWCDEIVNLLSYKKPYNAYCCTEHVTVVPSPLEAVLQVVEHCLQCIVLFSMCRLCCLAISRRVSCWALETFSVMK